MSDAPPAEVVVTGAESGVRLDRLLARRWGVSRAEGRRLLERGQVHVNGRVLRAADKALAMAPGDRVRVADFVPVALQLPIPEPGLDVPVLAEGEGWVVFDKPAGMPVHPLAPDERGTLLNFAVARYPQLPGAGVGEGGLRSGVVHRLDVETSGCLAIATTQPAWQTLRTHFREHTARKRYVALVHGQLTGHGRDDLWLHIAQHRPAKVRIISERDARDTPGARRCTHTWRVLDAHDDRTLVEIDLHTGFLHQIRAAFAHRGHPVLGDPLYGHADAATRLMLHATSLVATPASALAPTPPAFRVTS